MNEQFDYIIIGAGTAGCILANRLTENKKIRVFKINYRKQKNLDFR